MIFNRQSLSGNLSTTLIISGVLLTIGIILFFFVLPNRLNPAANLEIGNGIFKARLATNDAERINGLSGTDKLEPDQALLMAFPYDNRWGIWMKDMKFPIDIVWLNNNKKVVSIVKNASPAESTDVSHIPPIASRYVIEFPAGTVDRMSISAHNTAVFQIDDKKVN